MNSFGWRGKVVVYFAVPFASAGLLVAAYFSGVEILQQIVSPKMRLVHPDTPREFGLLENLQHLMLLAMAAVAGAAAYRKPLRLERIAFGLLAAFAVFVFLEEVDYGLHWYEYAMGINRFEAADVRNLHNQGEVTQYSKQIADGLTILLFVVLPWAVGPRARPLIRYLTPTRFMTLTAVAALAVRTLAHGLHDAGFPTNGTLDRNLSEFRELITYYAFLLYVVDIGLRRSYAAYAGHGEGRTP